MTPEIENEQRGLSQSQSLFQLETELVELMTLREEMAEAGESTEAVDNQLAEYVQREVKRVDNIRAYLRHCEVMQAAAAEEVKRLSALAHSWKQRRERLMECCRITMEAVGAKRIEGQTGSISLKGNGGLAPLEIYNAPLVPDEFKVVTMTLSAVDYERIWQLLIDLCVTIPSKAVDINNAKLRDALKVGTVPGARLGDRGQHIEVR